MTYSEWKEELGRQCNDVVQKFNELYSHLDTLATLPEIADQDIRDDASAFIMVKLRRVHSDISAAANPPNDSAKQGDSSTNV